MVMESFSLSHLAGWTVCCGPAWHLLSIFSPAWYPLNLPQTHHLCWGVSQPLARAHTSPSTVLMTDTVLQVVSYVYFYSFLSCKGRSKMFFPGMIQSSAHCTVGLVNLEMLSFYKQQLPHRADSAWCYIHRHLDSEVAIRRLSYLVMIIF